MSAKTFAAIALLGAIELAVTLYLMRPPWSGLWLFSLGCSLIEGMVLGRVTTKTPWWATALVCLGFVTAVPVEVVLESIRQDDANLFPIVFVIYFVSRAVCLAAGFWFGRRVLGAEVRA